MTPARQTPVPTRAPALIDFFRHHGIWAPGVRLFRRMQFKSKAGIICAVLLAPLAMVSWALWQAKQDVIDFAEKERAGIAVMAHAAHFLNELTNSRNAARAIAGGHDAKADLATARSQADVALAEVEKHLTASGDPLAVRPSFDKLKTAWAATAAAPTALDAEGRTVYGPVVTQMQEFLVRIGDDSNLVLDPDVDSFYLINSMVLELPKAMENTGQTRAWSTFAAAKGQIDKKDLARFQVWAAGTGSGVAALRDYIQRAVTANPALKGRIELDKLDQVAAYLSLAQSAVSDGKNERSFEGNATYELPANFGLVGHIGYSNGSGIKEVYGQSSYYDWSVGVTYTWSHFDMSLKWVDGEDLKTFQNGTCDPVTGKCSDVGSTEARAIFQISTTFPWKKEGEE